MRDFDSILKYQQICQILKDRLCCNEGLNSGNLIDRQFNALSSSISPLSITYPSKYNTIIEKYLKNLSNDYNIIEIYEITREDENYTLNNNNNQFLYHGTSCGNLLGLFYRGFLLPNVIESEWYLKGSRRDCGMLGSGIYFTDDILASLKYTTESKYQNNSYQFLFINEVQLGEIYETNQFNCSLNKPPKGFNSVKGVKGENFTENEYVIYNQNQQKIRYLIQCKKKNIKNQENSNKITNHSSITQDENVKFENLLKNIHKQLIHHENQMDIDDSFDDSLIENPKNQVMDSGLKSNSGQSIPLKSSHIRVNILDVIGTVRIFQEYVNESNEPIESKYIFPLDEKSAVCGFECFINGKQIIGQVKEKEKAHKQYKKAIEKGDGAYLLDQNEKSDSWTLSVGNLPPKSKVIIKITYITELEIENDEIIFKFPIELSGEKILKKKISQEITQNVIQSSLLNNNDVLHQLQNQSFELTCEMPFNILNLYSSSHSNDCFYMKSTDTKATIQLKSSLLFDKDFQFHIQLSNANEPRMWIEEENLENNNNSENRAAMLCFYPKFDFSKQIDHEFIFLIDQSESMKSKENNHLIRNILYEIFNYLPENQIYYNIITFGCNFKQNFILSKQNTKENINQSKKWLNNNLNTNLGSTNLYKILNSIYLRVNKSKPPRNIIILTDGEIHNFKSVIKLIQNNSNHTRLFTCGIGKSINKYTLHSLSYYGRGCKEIFNNNNNYTIIRNKIIALLKKALQPSVSNISIDWVGDDCNSILQAPNKILSIFYGEHKIIYGMLGKHLCSQAILRSLHADGELIHIRVASNSVGGFKNCNDMIHKLTTRAILHDYEFGCYSDDPNIHSFEKLKKKNEIIQLSCKYNVVCSLTSFIAIEKRKNNQFQNHLSVDVMNIIKNDHSSDLISYIPWGECNEFINSKKMKQNENLYKIKSIKPKKPAPVQILADQIIRESSAISSTPNVTGKRFTNLYYNNPIKKRKISVNVDDVDDCLLGIQKLHEDFCAESNISVRNLRIREDTSKYLANLDLDNAYYDPKNRSMMDKPSDDNINLHKRMQLRQLASINGTLRDDSGNTDNNNQHASVPTFIPPPFAFDNVAKRTGMKKRKRYKKRRSRSRSRDRERGRGSRDTDRDRDRERGRERDRESDGYRHHRTRFDEGKVCDGYEDLSMEQNECDEPIQPATTVVTKNELDLRKLSLIDARRSLIRLGCSTNEVESMGRWNAISKLRKLSTEPTTREAFSTTKLIRGSNTQSNNSQLSLEDEEVATQQRRERRRLQERLRRLKKNSEKQKPFEGIMPEQPLTGSDIFISCGACGMRGHMRTSRNCPLYKENTEIAFETNEPKSFVPLTNSQSYSKVYPPKSNPTQFPKRRGPGRPPKLPSSGFCGSGYKFSEISDKSSDSDSDTVSEEEIDLFAESDDPKIIIEYEKLLYAQSKEGFWHLTSNAEKLLAFPVNFLRNCLEKADYHNLGSKKALEVEKQFMTAIIIEVFLRSKIWNIVPQIQKAIEWLNKEEKKEISLCYTLSLSSNWRAFANQVLVEHEIKNSVPTDHIILNPCIHFQQPAY